MVTIKFVFDEALPILLPCEIHPFFLTHPVETNRYVRHKISELQLSLRSIWSRWSDVSVPEMKVFLDLIIDMGLT
jgi:hypothetical protein